MHLNVHILEVSLKGNGQSSSQVFMYHTVYDGTALKCANSSNHLYALDQKANTYTVHVIYTYVYYFESFLRYNNIFSVNSFRFPLLIFNNCKSVYFPLSIIKNLTFSEYKYVIFDLLLEEIWCDLLRKKSGKNAEDGVGPRT
jgi:hypothetical protein